MKCASFKNTSGVGSAKTGEMPDSLLIVLNGASSAGKTLTAQALIARLGADTMLTGLDDVLERTQPFGPENGGALRALRILRFQLSDGRLRLFKTLHRDAAAMLKSGQNVIVETALMDRRALIDAAECFAPVRAYFIGMKPPLAVSEQWEAQRGDRPIGQARRHYDLIHAHGVYDLVVDPSIRSPEQCADAIVRYIESTAPRAFSQLLQ
jgi:chloramphenicol 3-O phosphotransferase